MELEYGIGDVWVEVEVTCVAYSPPQNPHTAASDWDCYGYLEVDWEITSATNLEGGVDTDVDMEYLDHLVRESVMESIKSKDYDY